MRKLRVLFLILAISLPSAFAQKVKVGHDKGADFSKYASYSWAKLAKEPARPLFYLSLVGSIDNELKVKGLRRVESDGDLTLIPAGGLEYGLNTAAGTPITAGYSGPPPSIDATMWTGAGGSSSLMATYVPEGSLVLNFVDRGTNKVVWTGTMTEKLDLGNPQKSMELINKGISKLMKEFPPKNK
jgi:hypothetical protein